MWTVAVGERVFSVRDAKGLRQLAVLLERPGEEVHALDVVAAAEGHPGDARVRSAGDAGPALDEDAKRAYRERFEDVRAELDEAEAFNDPVRAERARTELEWLEQELTRAVGLGGRDRPQGSDAERARVNVTRSIRAAVKRIAERDAELGRLLEATVRTGTFCAYEPDPGAPVRWTVA